MICLLFWHRKRTAKPLPKIFIDQTKEVFTTVYTAPSCLFRPHWLNWETDLFTLNKDFVIKAMIKIQSQTKWVVTPECRAVFFLLILLVLAHFPICLHDHKQIQEILILSGDLWSDTFVDVSQILQQYWKGWCCWHVCLRCLLFDQSAGDDGDSGGVESKVLQPVLPNNAFFSKISSPVTIGFVYMRVNSQR